MWEFICKVTVAALLFYLVVIGPIFKIWLEILFWFRESFMERSSVLRRNKTAEAIAKMRIPALSNVYLTGGLDMKNLLAFESFETINSKVKLTPDSRCYVSNNHPEKEN